MPSERIPVDVAAEVFRRARASGMLSLLDTAVIFHDLGRLSDRIALLRQLFPESALHTLAVKANPLVAVLRHAVKSGAGLEAASMEEVHLAMAAGCPPEMILFDSPAKTTGELAFALKKGIRINADSLEELERIKALHAAGNSNGTVGLRVNPTVGSGSIAATSVATRGSRFGVSLDDGGEAAVVEAFKSCPWLCGLHVHVGSQGCELPLLTAAAKRVWQLRQTIHNELRRTQVGIVDIGGGVPAIYSDSDHHFSFHDYAEALRIEAPGLFAPDVRLITEFGRAIQANCGFTVARVEYVKRAHSTNVAVIHLGADFLLRPVYQPEFWHHDFALLDSQGEVKSGAVEPWSLAGPLCFSGDYCARGVMLPPPSPGDHILIRDTGAYTLGLWSRHCSRAIPLALGYDDSGKRQDGFVTLRHRETFNDIVSFWSP